jgi:hypothetical protein
MQRQRFYSWPEFPVKLFVVQLPDSTTKYIFSHRVAINQAFLCNDP